MKHFAILIFYFIYVTETARAQDVIIPDLNFKSSLVGNPTINTNGDGEIQVSEANAFSGTLTVSNANIHDLTGIAAFTAITGLDCSFNHITNLDLYANPAITDLNCYSNDLVDLNVSALTGLTALNCSYNHLTHLDVTANPNLDQLFCSANQLTDLNLSSNTAITKLGCESNSLTALTLSSNTNLINLRCGGNPLTTLDVSSNHALEIFLCSNCQLSSLDVSSNPALRLLICSYNPLINLNLNGATDLDRLSCYSTQLISLDVSTNSSLVDLNCSYNPLTSLNVQNGNNINMVNMGGHAFNALYNPNLTCIQVDDIAYSNANWSNRKDSTAFFSTNCSSTGFSNTDSHHEMMIYPNPTQGIFQILSSGLHTETKIIIRDVLENIVFEKIYQSGASLEIDLSNQTKGVYFVELLSNHRRTVNKIAIQ